MKENKILRKILSGLLSVVFMLSTTVCGAKTIRGIVLDKNMIKPIPGSTVMLIDKNKIYAVALTDSSGVFAFKNIELERFNFRVKRIGYAEAFVGPMLMSKIDTLNLTVKLDETEIVMEEQVVSEKKIYDDLVKIGFYNRKEMGMGKYITPPDLRKRHFSFVSDLLVGIPGLIVKRGQFGMLEIFSNRALNSALGPSGPVTIYVDGMQLDRPEDLDMLNASDIAAVEFYNISTSPSEYYGASGSLLLWTKK